MEGGRRRKGRGRKGERKRERKRGMEGRKKERDADRDYDKGGYGMSKIPSCAGSTWEEGRGSPDKFLGSSLRDK